VVQAPGAVSTLLESTIVEAAVGEPDSEAAAEDPGPAGGSAPEDAKEAGEGRADSADGEARRSAALQGLCPYEFEALAEIEDVKNPNVRWLSQFANAAHEPLDKLSATVFDTEVGSWLGGALASVLGTIHDGATWTVREQAILKDFERDGGTLTSFSEIPELSLERVDDAVGKLGRKYRIAAMVEGSLVGATGIAGMLADIPLIISIALRGVTEYAAYYGFYPLDDAEKRFVLDLVSTAAAPTLKTRQESLALLAQPDTHPGGTPAAAEDAIVASRAVEGLVEGILARMARGKVAQAIPLFGALIGGGFNRWFVAQVMSLAEALYRERFLIRRHSADLFVAVKPFEALR
jgi:hypothetical protein